jgi:outer membrane protein assembly factor BamB
LVVKEGRIFVQSPKALICLSLSGDILWKFSNVTSRESPASVASHPLVFDGKVYTTTYGYKYSPEAKVPPVSLFCLDAESGLVNWKYTDERYSPDESKNNKNYYLYPITFRPASANGTVYAVIEHRGVVAIDASSGELMWRVDGQAMTPPMVYNSNVYTTVISDSGSSYNSSETDVVQIVALDAQTGSLQWTHRISRHAVKLLAKNDHIFLYSDNVFFKLTARDGLLKWAMNHGELAGLSVQPSSLVASNNQIILNSYKSIARVDPKSGTLTTTQQLPTRSSSMSASLAFGGNVVFGTLPNQTLFSVS